jgi:hypothetical protein
MPGPPESLSGAPLAAPSQPGLLARASPFAMPETAAPAVEFSADANDLISFLKAIPVGVSLLRRSWPLQPWGALSAVVSAARGGAWDPERLPQLP